MYSTERVQPAALRTSRKVSTQSLVATMIKTLGEARTEDVVRGWMTNEPRIFNSDTKMLEVMAAGSCLSADSPEHFTWRFPATPT